MAATVPTENQENPLLDQAAAIGQPPSGEEKAASAQPPATEPKVGSYERFMSSFGSPSRWAGR